MVTRKNAIDCLSGEKNKIYTYVRTEDRFYPPLAVRRRRSVEIVRIRWFFSSILNKTSLYKNRSAGRKVRELNLPTASCIRVYSPQKCTGLWFTTTEVVATAAPRRRRRRRWKELARRFHHHRHREPLTRGWRCRFTPILQPDMVSWFINLFVAARQYIICICILYIHTHKENAPTTTV